MSIFNLLKAKPDRGQYLTARINARVKPVDRGDFFEDPLHDVLEAAGLGEVIGGGTEMADNPQGIASVDVDIQVNDLGRKTIDTIVSLLEKQGAPRGSRLISTSDDSETPFGQWEGLGLFLETTGLLGDMFVCTDPNPAIEKCRQALKGTGEFRGFWEGPESTALYFYGPSYEAIRTALQPLVSTEPEYKTARVEQIA